jgi:inward rectifier potassium channel
MAAFKRRKFNDLGLDTKGSSGNYRSVNKDGTFNIKKTNIPFPQRVNFFHSLLSMSWRNFYGLIAISYITVNLLFASIYMAIGVENLTATDGLTNFEKFMEAFFFSAQTITTLGYGRVAPVGIPANSIAAVESMLGLLTFALATGMLYGRFSRPNAKIRYSKHGVIAPYQDINGFMLRVVNPRRNHLLEVEATLTLSMKRENSSLRDFYLLELERPKVVFFPSMWTIVHPITKLSPLYGLTEAKVLEKDAEFIIMIRAFDESFSQTVYSRSSYKAAEIRWGQKFVYVSRPGKDRLTVDVGRIDETEEAGLNKFSFDQ